MIAQILAEEHTYERVTRDDGRMRMECNCGKRSRWSELSRPVQEAQDRHADEVAARHRHSSYIFDYDSRYPL